MMAISKPEKNFRLQNTAQSVANRSLTYPTGMRPRDSLVLLAFSNGEMLRESISGFDITI